MGNKSTYGLLILLASAFFYASYGVFSKIIGNSFAPYTQVWTHSIVTLLCFAIFLQLLGALPAYSIQYEVVKSASNPHLSPASIYIAANGDFYGTSGESGADPHAIWRLTTTGEFTTPAEVMVIVPV